MMTSATILHDEMWLEVFSCIPTKFVLSSVALVSHSWHTLSNQSLLWQNFCRDASMLSDLQKEGIQETEITDFKDFYRAHLTRKWNANRQGPKVEMIDAATVRVANASWKGGAICTTKGFSKGTHYWSYKLVSGVVMMGVIIGDEDITQPSLYNSKRVQFIYDSGADLYGNRIDFSSKPEEGRSEILEGETVGVALNCTGNEPVVSFYINEKWQGNANLIDVAPGTLIYPAVELGSIRSSVTLLKYYPYLPKHCQRESD